MANLEDEIRLGVQSVYDENPIESIKTDEVKVATKQATTVPKKPAPKNASKTTKVDTVSKQESKAQSQARTTTKRTSKVPIKPIAVSKAECQEVLKLFNEVMDGMPDYKNIYKDFQGVNATLQEKKEWIEDTKDKIMNDKAVPTNEEWADINRQASELFAIADNLMSDYNKKDVFNIGKEDIENLKKLLLNDGVYEGFKNQGYGSQYAIARQKLVEFIEDKENAKSEFDKANENLQDVKSGFGNLDRERSRQKARVQEERAR